MLAERLFIERIVGMLRSDQPTELVPRETAAVAVIFARDTHDGEIREEQLLLVKRSVHETDPWSGHVAFPGGRAEAYDSTFRTTAVRETKEEIGIDLESHAKFLGYMDTFQARTRAVLVVPSVFVMKDENARPHIMLNEEVFSHRWTAFKVFLQSGSRSTYTIAAEDSVKSFPAYQIDDYLIWGLTERVISTMVDCARQT